MKEFNIEVQPTSRYLPEQSSTEQHRFLWSYDIVITNQSDAIVQLLNRFWRITDMFGNVEEIHGPGVVGLQPIIKPQKKFTYSSFCQLVTPQGTMEGYYELQNVLDEKRFTIEIPKFILTSPESLNEGFRSRLH